MREGTITTMAERRREIGEQMNWTISLRARAEGQALCKTEKGCGGAGPGTEREAGGNQAGLSGERMGSSGVRQRQFREKE